MLTFLKNKWEILLVAGIIFIGLLICCAPDFTWINTDCDGIHYTYAAKYMYPAHKTSAPLFLLLGRLFLWLPIGTDAWRMSFMSVLATTVSTIFIMLTVSYYSKRNIWAIILSGFLFGGSALVISQSTIIESYALVTMFSVLAYYFCFIKNNMWLTAISLGLGLAVHHLIGFPILIILIFCREFRNWKYIGLMSLFLLFYLYIPITARPPNMWGNTGSDFWGDNITTALMLIGGISIWDLPKRIIETLSLIGITFALNVIFFFKLKWRHPLLYLTFLPFLYYMVDLAPQTYVYMMPGIAFGAIACGYIYSRYEYGYKFPAIFIAPVIAFSLLNFWNMDIGRTLDPELSASKYYYEELAKVPDGEILLAQQGWEWAAIYHYNREYDRNIIPVCIPTLPSESYQNDLRAMGANIIDYPDISLGNRPNAIANTMIEINDKVWTTQLTVPETYGSEIIPAKEIVFPYKEIEKPKWQFIPDEPFDIITGAVEVEKWTYIIFSNYSVLTFFMMGTIGFVPCWIIYMLIIKRKKFSFGGKNVSA